MEAEPSETAATTAETSDLDAGPIFDAIAQLTSEGIRANVVDRVIRLPDPVTGSAHLAVLQALGLAADAPPVGAAAHGPSGVAAGVWLAPLLYIVRWTGTSRWVAAYQFSKRGRPDDYLREATGIPSNLVKDNWYGDVPDEVNEAFFSVGILLDEPPFPVPQPPPAPVREAERERAPRAPRAPREPRAPRPPRAITPRKPPAPKKAQPATRACASCNMQKHISQFVEGSDLCVDCR